MEMETGLQADKEVLHRNEDSLAQQQQTLNELRDALVGDLTTHFLR